MIDTKLMMDGNWQGQLATLFEDLVYVGVLVVVWLVAGIVIRWAIGRWFRALLTRAQLGTGRSDREKKQRARTLTGVIRTTVMVTLGVVLIGHGLSTLGVQIMPLIAGAGIAGLAIGFGAQSLVKDVITGLFILIEDQLGIGDVVKIGLITGKVEDFNLRRTVLRDLEGVMHVIPNSQILMVSNFTKGWSGLNLLIGVSHESDLNKAEAVLEKEFEKMMKDPELAALLVDKPELKGVEELSPTAVKLQVSVRTREGEQWRLRREMLLRIKQAFDKAKIKMG